MTSAGSGEERRLEGGWQTEVHEADGVVYRSPGPQSSTVIALLRHLEEVGFDAAPRVAGSGFDSTGRETLVFMDGDSPHPGPWDDEAVAELGGLLRQLHEATATFRHPSPVWQEWFARDLPGVDPVIGHGDLGPWNILGHRGKPVAFIDWDNAGPVDATWELAQVGWLNAHLYDDDLAERNGLPPAERRAAQLRILVDEYGLEPHRRDHFVDQIAQFAVHAARQEAVDVTADSLDAFAADGFPTMWAITWRARSASWIFRNRDLLTRALTH